MSVFVKLQNLPSRASSNDILTFFRGLRIPNDGVRIVGHDTGTAFITFFSDEDARQAVAMSGGTIRGSTVRIRHSSRNEMFRVTDEARQDFQEQDRRAPGSASSFHSQQPRQFSQTSFSGDPRDMYGGSRTLGASYAYGAMNANNYNFAQDNYGQSHFAPMNNFLQMQPYGMIPPVGYSSFDPGNGRDGFDCSSSGPGYGRDRQSRDAGYGHRDRDHNGSSRDRNDRSRHRSRSRSRERGDSRSHSGRHHQNNPPVEIAFRVDTRSERISVQDVRSFQYNQLPTYTRNNFYQDNMLGASEEYISKLPPNRRCKPKIGVDEFGNVVDATTEEPIELPNGTPASELSETAPKARINPSATTKPIQFLSLTPTVKISKQGTSISNRIDFGNSLNLNKKPGSGIHEKTENYNAQLRKEPKNIRLWREFVQFQEQVFDDFNQVFDNDETNDRSANGQPETNKKKKKGKAKGKLKALIEKKISILDRALASNPKCIELCVDKLDLVYEIYKPTFVLLEWRKFTSVNQEEAPFWFEYHRFASTQLQIFSSSSISQTFQKTFEKFRNMLTPSYQAQQRPIKSHLVLADLLFSICVLLRNAGFTERSVAIQQAQLEIDFNMPGEQKDWKKTLADLDKFWSRNTPRFGEPGSIGWKNQPEESTPIQSPNFIPDCQVSTFEDEFFASISDFELESPLQKPDSVTWLYIESLRSKLYFVPWRPTEDAAAEACDDTQRLVLSADVSPYLSNIPRQMFSSDTERQSMYFRHLLNFLLTLREDFLPRTHTLDSILSPIGNLALSDSRTLISEVFYCKKFLHFYHVTSNPNSSSSVDADGSITIQVPEGFRLNEFNLPSQGSEMESALPLIQKYSASVEQAKESLLTKSEANHLSFVRSIVEQSLDHLDPKFAATLVQAFLRFEQRNTYNSKENHKIRMKSARNLMKHEKLRSSTGAYTELALLEYFGGLKEKAVDLLVKAINSSGKSVREMEIEEALQSNLDLIAEITRSYRVLAELHLRESPEIALAVLIALGNKFSAFELPKPSSQKPNTNALLKAKKLFGLVMNWLVPTVKTDEGEMETDTEDGAVNFESKLVSDKCVEFLLQDTNLLIEWTTAYGLFRYLTGDLSNASELYSSVLESVKPKESLSRSSRYSGDSVFRHHVREQLFINWSKLCALVLSTSPMENSKFRNILCNALQEFPSSPPLLVLFTDVESQCSIVGKLWRVMVSIVKQDSSQNTVSLHWAPLFMTFGLAQQIEKLEEDEKIGLDRFGLGGPAVPPDTIFYKLDALLAAAESNTLTRNVPLIWRIHLKHLVLRANQGKDVMRARAIFYDAISHCPSSKALYLDGIGYFPDMYSEINGLLTEKGILVRLPKEELDLLLDIDTELEMEAREAESKKKVIAKATKAEPDVIEIQENPTAIPKSTRVTPKVQASPPNVKKANPKANEDDEVQVLSDGEIDDCEVISD